MGWQEDELIRRQEELANLESRNKPVLDFWQKLIEENSKLHPDLRLDLTENEQRYPYSTMKKGERTIITLYNNSQSHIELFKISISFNTELNSLSAHENTGEYSWEVFIVNQADAALLLKNYLTSIRITTGLTMTRSSNTNKQNREPSALAYYQKLFE